MTGLGPGMRSLAWASLGDVQNAIEMTIRT
jgi:hypothetical protein